jgi:uncharacterized protein YceH (UPF0502 family)
MKLPRQPGVREPRWLHLMCGEPTEADLLPRAVSAPVGGLAALEARVARLEEEVADLRCKLELLIGP